MTTLVVCGQAPSRIGDGRAFTGPSGKRLAALFGLKSYEELASQVTLTNIFECPASPRRLPARRRPVSGYQASGDEFDSGAAAERGLQLLQVWSLIEDRVVVVACGHAVNQALTGRKGVFYKGRIVQTEYAAIEVWCFPHPSGASSYWNYRSNKLQAANFLRKLLKREGMLIAQ
jgi:uracil-DNA glycosylase